MQLSVLLTLAFNSFLVQNIVLSRFLGICSFMGVSGKSKSAVGMGISVLVVITSSSAVSWWLYHKILVPNELEYMRTIAFILVISALVQLLEMVIKKITPALYKSLGIYLPLITTNCAVLGVAVLNIDNNFNFWEMLVFSAFTALGYTFIIYVFSLIRESLDKAPILEGFKGTPNAFITASIMSLIVSGFLGIV
jgi:electron transport complex protein RnfA